MFFFFKISFRKNHPTHSMYNWISSEYNVICNSILGSGWLKWSDQGNWWLEMGKWDQGDYIFKIRVTGDGMVITFYTST